LAHSLSALKRWRQNERRRARNKPVRTAARTAVKQAHDTVLEGPTDEAQAAVREAARVLDKAAKHNVIHKNKAARQKSRLMKQLAKAGAGEAPVAEPPKKGQRKTTAKKTATKKPAAKKPATRSRTAKK
jgi:small subunit ribosomal protein S20